MIARVNTRTLLGAKHPVGNTCWPCSVASPLSKATQVTRDKDPDLGGLVRREQLGSLDYYSVPQ